MKDIKLQLDGNYINFDSFEHTFSLYFSTYDKGIHVDNLTHSQLEELSSLLEKFLKLYNQQRYGV